MKYTQHSIAGRAKQNEDRVLVSELTPAKLLAVMADGMGGLDNGERASEIAVNEIEAFLRSNNDDNTYEDTFSRVIQTADDAIAKEAFEKGLKMGCAIAVAIIENGQLHCISLGNIHILLNDKLITADDVYVDSLGGTYLTKSLRGRGIPQPLQVIHCELKSGWHVRICSDGFYNNDESDDASVIDIME